eukprot:COSAG01_NODE_12993_length_1651_cov_17.447165_2_plen_97_part_00
MIAALTPTARVRARVCAAKTAAGVLGRRRPAGRSEAARAACTHGWLSTLLIESQEEVRSDLRSRKFAQTDQIDNPGWIRKWIINPTRIDRKNSQRP